MQLRANHFVIINIFLYKSDGFSNNGSKSVNQSVKIIVQKEGKILWKDRYVKQGTRRVGKTCDISGTPYFRKAMESVFKGNGENDWLPTCGLIIVPEWMPNDCKI